MSSISNSLQQTAEQVERDVLEQLRVGERISSLTKTPNGLAAFAEAFYFCRVGFVRLNFILGERCASDERLWVGLARNLWEEAGAGSTPPHNELYRRFLEHSTVRPESELVAPAFAEHFDRRWESFVRDADILDALFAFAVYEALDAPDYQMLFHALSGNVQPKPLEFFKVHTEVRHVELFDEALAVVPKSRQSTVISQAMNFVIPLQKGMWLGLLKHMSRATPTTTALATS